MGIFLVIALFFNNISLLDFSITKTDAFPNHEIRIICDNQQIEKTCYENIILLENSTESNKTDTTRSTLISCENSYSYLNCTSNISNLKNEKSQDQLISESHINFFSFVSIILFLVIAFVVLIDAFSYIRIYEHAKKEDKKRAIVDVLSDLTIFLFIIPFVYLITFFLVLMADTFGQLFISLSFLLGIITVYVSEIIIFMFLGLWYLNSLKRNRLKELYFVIACLVLGIIAALVCWVIIPETLVYTSTISMAFILMAIITFIRPYIEK